MCKDNDRGCCFCLPSFISLILLALYDILILVISLLNISTFDGDYIFQALTYITAAIAVWQLIPFILFFIMRQDVWPRALIFISHVVSLLWMSAYFIMVIVRNAPYNCKNNPGDTCGLSDFIQWFLVFCLIVNFIFMSLNLFGAFKFAQAAR